jgi:CheY-like chemotaxis protein
VNVDAELVAGVVRLRVADTGIGIPPERLDDAFAEYVRLDTGGAAEGLGIGLAIVKRAADLIGHVVQIDSMPGRGTTVSVGLPLHVGVVPLAVASAPADHATPDPGDIIAIIENDRESRLAMQALLTSWGYTVVSGDDSRSIAAALPAGRRPALILADLPRGAEDGFVAISALRGPGGAGAVPAWLLTGDLDASVPTRAAQADITLMHKPVQTRRLRAAIAAALGDDRERSGSPAAR